jgi:uncharacterized protein (TIGR02145 family)
MNGCVTFRWFFLLILVINAYSIDINGILKDSTSGNQIMGAEVSLVFAGLKDTTDGEGKFHLKDPPTSTLSSSKVRISTISNGVNFNLSNRENITLLTYSVQGKLVHRMSIFLEPGSHSLRLPRPLIGKLIHRIIVGENAYTFTRINLEMEQSFRPVSKVEALFTSSHVKKIPSDCFDTLIVMYGGFIVYSQLITNCILDDYDLQAAVFFNITYDGNAQTGGSPPPHQTKTYGIALPLAPNSGNLVKAGFIFSGWNTLANGNGATYSEGSAYTVNSNTTLYAKWFAPGIIAGPKVSDADGYEYSSVIIGNQTWTVENLRTTKFNDGSSIPYIYEGSQWSNMSTPGYTLASENDKYGALYNWYAVNSGRLAPSGWRIPTDADWEKLQNYLISSRYNWDSSLVDNKIGKSMSSQSFWASYGKLGSIGNDQSTNNLSGFTAIPGGGRSPNGNFFSQTYGGYWWSSSDTGASGAWCRGLYYDYENLVRLDNNKKYGFSLRLLKE